MRDAMRLGIRLLLFMLVAALALSGTDMITRDPIAEQKALTAQGALRAVLPAADTFEEMTLDAMAQYPLLTAVYQGLADGQIVGYALTAAPQGYGGPIPITLGVTVDGAIGGVAVSDLKETAGLGSRVGEAPYLSQYDGLAADPAVIDARIDVLSGVTVSSAPFKEAARQMVALTMDALAIAPNAAFPPLAGEDVQRGEQLPAANRFVGLQPYVLMGEYDTLQAVYRAAQGEDTVGYTFELAPRGFVDVLRVRASVDAQGLFTAVSILENNETEGYGLRLSQEPEFLAQFPGNPATPEDYSQGVDALSGATVSSNAVLKAVGQAASFYQTYLLAKPSPDDGLTFEDIVLPAPDDYKAVQSAQRALRDGTLALYRFVVRATGYNEDVPLMLQIDVDAQGDYLALTVLEQSETPGIGSEVFTNEAHLAQFLGKPAAVATPDEVQAVTGATVTSDALQRALRQAARAYQSLADAPPAEPPAPAAEVFDTEPGAFEGADFAPLAFEDTEKKFATVRAIDTATRDGALLGYRLVSVVTGYNETDKIILQFEIDTAGIFVDVRTLAHAETPDIGGLLLKDSAHVSALLEQPAVPETADLLDAVSGATVTADAIRRAARQATLAYQAIREVP